MVWSDTYTFVLRVTGGTTNEKSSRSVIPNQEVYTIKYGEEKSVDALEHQGDMGKGEKNGR